MKNNPNIPKGIKRIAIALPLAFLGPILISIGFRALKDHIYLWLILGIIISLTAILLTFLGIKFILKGLFDD